MQNNQKVLMLGGGTSNSMLLRLMASSTLVPVDDVLTLSDFAVNDVEAALALSFTTNEYRTANTSTTFADAFTGNSPKLTYDPGSASSSQSTMVNSSGNIVWAPHNLLTYSEDFTNGWSSFGTTEQLITDNTSPVGNDQVSEVTFTAGTFKQIRQSPVTSNGDQITFRVWAKAGTLDYVAFAPQNVSALSSHRVIVDLSDGSFVQEPTTPVSCSVVDAGSDWYLITASGVVSNSAGHISIQPSDASGNNIDAAGTVLLTGAHVYRSDLGGMAPVPGAATGFETYVPTNGSAEYLPRVGHHVYNGSTWVNEGLLIESEPRTNLVTHSVPDNTNWTVTGLTLDDTTGYSAPDGTQGAVKLTSSGSGTNRIRISSVGPTDQTQSVYAKAVSGGFLQLLDGATASRHANFDLNSGAVGSSGSEMEPAIEDCGNGWYRCSVVISGATNVANFTIYVVDNSTAAYGKVSTSADEILVYGAQIEEGSTPSSYIPTSGSTVTRGGQSLTVPPAEFGWPEPEYIGPNLVTTDWTLTQSNISAGALNIENSGTFSRAINGDGSLLTAGKVYLLSFDITSVLTAGNVRLRLGGAASSAIAVSASVGSYSSVLVAASTSSTVQAETTASNTFTGTIDNISVREVNPLSVSIQMDGRMTYADDGASNSVSWWLWNGTDDILAYYATDGAYDRTKFQQALDVAQNAIGSQTEYLFSPGNLVPFNIAGRFGSAFVNGAVDGVALTADTTPTALPDLSNTNLQIAHNFMGTIGQFRQFAGDIGDAGLVTATNPSTEPTLSLTFDGTASGSFYNLNWSE